MHLQTLARYGLVEVLRGRDLTSPNIYVVTKKGLQSVGENALDSQASRRRRTGNHLQHELLITEFAIRLDEEARLRAVRIAWKERLGLAHHSCFASLVPDFGFLFIHALGRQVCLVEVSSGEESGTRLLQKLEGYAAWSDTPAARDFLMQLYRDSGAQDPRPTFRCLWIMHNRLVGDDHVRLRQLIYAGRQIPADVRNRMWCTTATSLVSASTGPRWLRLADLEAVFAAGLRGRDWHRQVQRQIGSVQRHCLFPTVEIKR